MKSAEFKAKTRDVLKKEVVHFRNEEHDNARKLFTEIAKENPEDVPAGLYLERYR